MNNITELVFILDRSGSMYGLEGDTIGGFNSMLERQKKEEGTALVTTVLFSDTHSTLHDRLAIDSLEPLTDKDYTTGGCTALLDTVGDTIEHISLIHRYARPEDVPARTLFIITTDGMENASSRYTQPQVKAMIEAKKSIGWEFLFLGANIDAVTAAGSIGIRADRAVHYCADSTGTMLNFSAMSKAISSVRACNSIDSDWAEEVRAYYEETSGGNGSN